MSSTRTAQLLPHLAIHPTRTTLITRQAQPAIPTALVAQTIPHIPPAKLQEAVQQEPSLTAQTALTAETRSATVRRTAQAVREIARAHTSAVLVYAVLQELTVQAAAVFLA